VVVAHVVAEGITVFIGSANVKVSPEQVVKRGYSGKGSGGSRQAVVGSEERRSNVQNGRQSGCR